MYMRAYSNIERDGKRENVCVRAFSEMCVRAVCGVGCGVGHVCVCVECYRMCVLGVWVWVWDVWCLCLKRCVCMHILLGTFNEVVAH